VWLTGLALNPFYAPDFGGAMNFAMSYFFHAATLAALGFSILSTTLIGRCLMATQAQVDVLTAQVVKIGQEVTTAKDVIAAELADVKAQLAAAGVPAEQVDLTGLAAAVQNLDDIHPDPVVAPEVEGEPEDEDEDGDEDEDVSTEPVAVGEPVIEDAAPVE
jgi:hypothetical protein